MRKPNARLQYISIVKTELLQLVRDKRALFAALVLPLLLYPWLFAGQQKIEAISEKSLSERTLQAAYDLEGLSPEWHDRIWETMQSAQPMEWQPIDASELRDLEAQASSDAEKDGLETSERRRMYEELLGEEQMLLVIAKAPGEVDQTPEVALYFDVKQDASREAEDRVSAALGKLEREASVQQRKQLLGGDPAAHLDLATVDVASAEQRSGAMLGRFLPLLLVMLLISGGAFAALTVFAGEREGGTLESILVQPIDAKVLGFGKYTAVAVAAFATLVANLGALLLCLLMGWTGGEDGGIGGLRVSSLLGGFFYLPGALLLCGLLCLALGKAKTFREGQYLLFPITLLAAIPSAVVLQPSLPNNVFLSAVPFAGPALVLRDILRGDTQILHILVMTLSHLVWVAWTLKRLSYMLEGERALSNAGESQRFLKMGPARHGMRWGFCGVLLFYLLGTPIQSHFPQWGIAYSIWGILVPLAIACAWRARKTWAPRSSAPGASSDPKASYSLRTELGLQTGSPRIWLGAALMVPAMTWAVQHLMSWQEVWLPLPSFMTQAKGLEEYLLGLPVTTLLFLFALTPAICEELFFRGALLSSLRRGMSTPKALLWQTVFFAAAHASVHRLLPTAILGLLLGWITLRARSILPAILFHFAYNASQVLQGTERLPQQDQNNWHTYLACLGVLGIALLWRPRTPQPEPLAAAYRQPGWDV